MELEMILIGADTIHHLAHHSQDKHSGYHDTCGSKNCENAVECVGLLERTYENCHLGNETAESGKTKVSKTGNHEADTNEWHDTDKTAQLTNVTGMGTMVNHTDTSKEQRCEQSVGKHLKNCARSCCAVDHKDCKKHKTTVGNRRVSVYILQVGLYAS